MAQKINVKKFDKIISGDKLVVVDFYADWCGPCKVIAPIIDELSETFEDRVVIAKVDVENEEELTSRYGIKKIPTILFFKNGEIVDKTSGSVPKIQLEDMINSHI